jgi:hypothetical protein
MKFPRLYRCSRDDCRASTLFPFSQNSRKRWLIDVILENTEEDADGVKHLIDASLPPQVKMHLCPKHAAEQFGLEERDFIGLENMEGVVREVQNRPSVPSLLERFRKRVSI